MVSLLYKNFQEEMSKQEEEIFLEDMNIQNLVLTISNDKNYQIVIDGIF